MTERSRVRIPAGAAGEFSSPGSTNCADSSFGIRALALGCFYSHMSTRQRRN